MNKALSDNQVEQFHEQGFLAGLPVWDDRVVERAQAHFRQVTAELESHGLTHNDVNGWWALNRTYWNQPVGRQRARLPGPAGVE